MIFVTCPRARGDQDEASKALEDFLSTANDATSSGRRRIAGARLDPWSWYTVSVKVSKTGWWFQFLNFTPKIGEMIHFD